MDDACAGCGARSLATVMTIAGQPPSNRYHVTRDEPVETHSLVLGYCRACGLVQLTSTMPPDTVRSRFAWLVYNEPEGHLDALVERLLARAVEPSSLCVTGVTYKDDTTLGRFARNGVAAIRRLDPREDLGIAEPLAGLETIQALLTPDVAREVARRRGQADIVLVRHLLEHAHRPSCFLEACRCLTKPGGLLVFEVPDIRKALESHDHCYLWEEHISYFTVNTLRNFFLDAGCHDVAVEVFPQPLEDSLVAVVRNAPAGPPGARAGVVADIAALEKFAGGFQARGNRLRRHLRGLQARGKVVYLFGAGHLAARFVNFYGLTHFLAGVIDDNPDKLRHLMPGSKLPIVPSERLAAGGVDLCLLALSPESEQKVVESHQCYVARGGVFRSIFAASANSIDRELTDE